MKRLVRTEGCGLWELGTVVCGGERRERSGECDQSCHVLAMVENCGDGRTGARGRERGSFELSACCCVPLARPPSPSSQPFGWSLEWWRGRAGDGTNARGGKLQACLGGGATHLYSPRSDRRDCSCSKPGNGKIGRNISTAKPTCFYRCAERWKIRTRLKFSRDLVAAPLLLADRAATHGRL